MNLAKDFLYLKERAIDSLEKAQRENKLDSKIKPLLDIINDFDGYYTSSSCAGRIVLLEIPRIGDKKQARFLGKWHNTITSEDIFSKYKKAKKGILWLLAQSPIIHVAACSFDAADKLVKTSIASGFKNTSLKSTEKKIIVEICSTERLDAPIGQDGNLFCNREYLKLLVDISNEVIEKSNVKINRFEEKLRKSLSTPKTTNK